MGVGRQSRRVCFGAKPDKGFLDKKNLAVSGSGKGTRTRVDDATQRDLVAGAQERQLVVGQERGELVAGSENESWWLESREASSRRQLRLETTEGS